MRLEIAQERRDAKEVREAYRAMDEMRQQLLRNIRAYVAMLGTEPTPADARKRLTPEELEAWRRELEEYDGTEKQRERQNVTRRDSVDILNYLAILAAVGTLTGIIGKGIRDSHEENYMHTAYEVQRAAGIGWKLELPKIDIKLPWTADGLNFIDRLKAAAGQLRDSVEREVARITATEKPAEKAEKAVNEAVDKAEVRVKEQIVGENGHANYTARQKAFTELGVEEYVYLATLDNKTCTTCQPLDQKTFKVKDMLPGVNASKMHPRCRCTERPVIDSKYVGKATRAARSNITGKTTHKLAFGTSYAEWKSKYSST